MEDIINSDDFAKQSEVLARSNAQIEQQIILINASNSLSAQEKKARIDSIVAIEAEAQSRKIFKQIQLEKDLKELKKGLNQVSFSFKRMLDNMSSSIDLASAKIEAFGESMELASSSAKGQAKVGTGSGIDNLINTLKNPRAASETQRQASFSQASSMFGGQASNVENILTTGAGLEDTILGTINRTLSTAGSAETNEAVGAKVSNAVKEQLRNLSIPPAIADKLSSQIEKAVSKLRTQGDDTIDFSQIVEEVPELAKSIDIFSNVNKSVIKSLEFLKSQFDLLASATNQQIELQLQVNKTLRDAQNIIIKGNQNLSRALGRDASLGEQRTAIETPLRSMAGTTNPNQIGMNFRDLENTRSQLQEGRAGAARSGDVDLVKQFDNKLRDTNIAISENVAALQQMANSTELASAALNEIEKIQRKTQAGASIIEKLVTSTPKEIGSMNRAFARLSNNMMGMTNVGGNTETRKQSLEMFQMIAPLLGDNQGLKANVLQSMLAESGVAMTPVMQQVLDAMRNPESDPQMQQAIATYQQAINTQSQANVELAKINQNLSNDIAKKTGDAVAAAIQGVEIKFNQQQINDILNGINSVPDQPAPAQGIATGGLVYRAVGGTIDRKVFKPRGTDTVPAMLTPGEFVVNRSATQANLPLLQSINNGYQRGGQVKYYSTGGYVSNFLKLDEVGRQGIKDPEMKVSEYELPIAKPQFFKDGEAKLVASPATATFKFPSSFANSVPSEIEDFIQKLRDEGSWSTSADPSSFQEYRGKSGLARNVEIVYGVGPVIRGDKLSGPVPHFRSPRPDSYTNNGLVKGGVALSSKMAPDIWDKILLNPSNIDFIDYQKLNNELGNLPMDNQQYSQLSGKLDPTDPTIASVDAQTSFFQSLKGVFQTQKTALENKLPNIVDSNDKPTVNQFQALNFLDKMHGVYELAQGNGSYTTTTLEPNKLFGVRLDKAGVSDGKLDLASNFVSIGKADFGGSALRKGNTAGFEDASMHAFVPPAEGEEDQTKKF